MLFFCLQVGYLFLMKDLIICVSFTSQLGTYLSIFFSQLSRLLSYAFILVSSKVPAYLNIVDIAGLVKGAHEGQGLGNAFLSHIRSVDAIFHLTRKFNE